MLHISIQEKQYQLSLFSIFLFVWAWSSWHPASSQNWFVENSMTFLFVPIIFGFCMWYMQLSKLSFSLITLFLILHIIGTHYNYGSVPFGNTLSTLLTIQGNIYDKFVHFSFGLLILYPLREFFMTTSLAKGMWGYLLPFNAILGLSALYEIFEWLTVLRLPPDIAYLFIGGSDPFDTTKDMFAAMVGALLAILIISITEKLQTKEIFSRNLK